jgi:hypothetical protein
MIAAMTTRLQQLTLYTVLRNAWHKSLVCNLFAICVIRINKILDKYKINFWQMQFAQSIFQFARFFLQFARFSLRSPIFVSGISQHRVKRRVCNCSFGAVSLNDMQCWQRRLQHWRRREQLLMATSIAI